MQLCHFNAELFVRASISDAAVGREVHGCKASSSSASVEASHCCPCSAAHPPAGGHSQLRSWLYIIRRGIEIPLLTLFLSKIALKIHNSV